jgi:hypothetical protein
MSSDYTKTTAFREGFVAHIMMLSLAVSLLNLENITVNDNSVKFDL